MTCLVNFIMKKTYLYIYRPQRSWGKVMFSVACVKNSVHRGVSDPLHAGIPPQTLWDQTPPTTRPPLGQDPPGPDPIQVIWATSGRYASYWNAILFCHSMKKNTVFACSTRHDFIQKGYIVQVKLMVCWSVVKLALKDNRTLYNIAWNGLHRHRECECGGNMTPTVFMMNRIVILLMFVSE